MSHHAAESVSPTRTAPSVSSIMFTAATSIVTPSAICTRNTHYVSDEKQLGTIGALRA